VAELNGHVALVTGGGRGIGAGISTALAHAGAAVAVAYAADEGSAARTAAAIGAAGGRALPVELRVEDRGSVQAALARVERELGPVDVLVNNGAIAQEKPFETLDDDDLERMLSINLLGPMRCAQAALPGMLDRGQGRIVNVVSIGGQWGGLNQVHYAAAKAGLINFTRSLAKLYSGRGVTANAVSPGLVATDMSQRELDSPEGRAKVAAIPSGRLGTVEDVAGAVLYLAGDAAGYVTGQTINVNGGMYFG
jgi:acetoacetyl-CoA reductase/3-oxoacyl-[acyl-carrier protein] reductase